MFKYLFRVKYKIVPKSYPDVVRWYWEIHYKKWYYFDYKKSGMIFKSELSARMQMASLNAKV